MNRIQTTLAAALAAGLFAATARADDRLEYAEPDGTIQVVPVVKILRSDEDVLIVRARVSGRSTRLKIPVRRILEFRLGNSEDVSQWSRRLATAKRLMKVGKLETQGTVDGAEALLRKISTSKEPGIEGDEEAYATRPEHNMYATFYLIETQLMMGRQGKPDRLDAALAAIAMFRERSEKRSGRTITVEVPGEGGTAQNKEVFAWGDNWLLPYVALLEARVQAAKGGRTKAIEIYKDLEDELKKNDGSPRLLARAIVERAALEAEGQDTRKQERTFRQAGTLMAEYARTQKDQFGKDDLRRAANRALVRGADLLLEDALETNSFDAALDRYRDLRRNEGQKDAALLIGARTGIGICLAEKGEGEKAYRELLAVVVEAGDQPQHAPRALYYLGRAAQAFAEEIDSGGGDGTFLRTESKRWWSDLAQRYPGSEWAKKAQDK